MCRGECNVSSARLLLGTMPAVFSLFFMTFGSLFSGIGGLDLGESLRQVVTTLTVESNESFSHQHYGRLFKLQMPVTMRFRGAKCQILQSVVMFIEVDVVNHFSFTKRPTKILSHNGNVFRNVTSAASVRMIRHQNVIVAIAKGHSLATLPRSLGGKNTTAFPIGIKRSALPFAFDGFAGGEPHAIHRSPDDFLCGSIANSDFGLSKPQDFVIVSQLLFREWDFVGVLVTHAGIIPNASKRKEAMP